MFSAACRRRILSDLGRAGEGQLAHEGISREFAPTGAGSFAVTTLIDPGGHAGPFGKFRQRQRGEGRQLSRLHHHRAAGAERRADLAREHGGWEIPRRDRRRDADRLFEHEQATVGRTRYHVAIDAPALFREPLDKAARIGDLPARFGERLAHFRRDDARQPLLIGHDQFEPAAHDMRALLRGAIAPAWQRPRAGLRSPGAFRLRPCRELGRAPRRWPDS